MNTSEQIAELAAALAVAHAEIDNPPLDKVNPHFKSKYASLGGHINAIRKPLSKHGISVVQTVSSAEGAIVLTTMLLHKSGQFISDALAFPMPGNATAQAAGSLLTYMRRYSLASIVGIVGEDDDDGNEDARPAFKPAEARGAMQPPPSRKPPENGKEWPKSGVTDCVFSKVAQRDGSYAIYADDCEFGAAWLRASNEIGSAVKEGTKRMEVEFTRHSPGIIDMTACRPAQPRKEGSLI